MSGLDFLSLDTEIIKQQNFIVVAEATWFWRNIKDWHLCPIKVLQLICLWIVGLNVFKGKTVDEALLTADSCSFWPWEIKENSQNEQVRGRSEAGHAITLWEALSTGCLILLSFHTENCQIREKEGVRFLCFQIKKKKAQKLLWIKDSMKYLHVSSPQKL